MLIYYFLPFFTLLLFTFHFFFYFQQLLWLLYDLNHLKTYPMALGNLGDLEEISPSPGRPPPIELFRESILAAQSFYNNMHVYPYTYLGGYLYRNGRYKGALEAWANAADVIRK